MKQDDMVVDSEENVIEMGQCHLDRIPVLLHATLTCTGDE